jgi:hypothetical protein
VTKTSATNKNGPDFSGPDWIELELVEPAWTTSFSSEQPFSLQALSSSLRSSSIDSPFTSKFASHLRDRGCVPFIRWFASKVKKKMRDSAGAVSASPAVSRRKNKLNIIR